MGFHDSAMRNPKLRMEGADDFIPPQEHVFPLVRVVNEVTDDVRGTVGLIF